MLISTSIQSIDMSSSGSGLETVLHAIIYPECFFLPQKITGLKEKIPFVKEAPIDQQKTAALAKDMAKVSLKKNANWNSAA